MPTRSHHDDIVVRARVGPVEVQITDRPIESALEAGAFDAVVSSDDTVLSMSGGVSAALRVLGGDAYVEEARRLAPLRVGQLVVSPPGTLPVRYVLQAVTVDWEHGIRPTERTVRHLARELFVRCEALEVRSVLVPALATGAARFPADVSARLLYEALVVHLSNRSTLASVTFALPDHEVFVRFLAGLSLDGRGTPVPLSLGAPDRGPQAGPAAAAPGMAVPPGREAEQTRQPPITRRAAEPAESWNETSPAGAGDVSRPAAGALRAPPAMGGATRPVLSSRYVLLEELGRGGFGVVHLAWDLVLRHPIAIKQLRPDVHDAEMLRQEAAIAMDLSHPGIVRAHHFDPGGRGTPAYLVMEYVAWPTAERWLAEAGEGALPAPAVAAIGRAVCDALAYAHERRVLHLDIKPGNLFVDAAGEQVKLSDFGIARLATRSGHAFNLRPAGTPGYMAPEQRTTHLTVGPATDLYQLAATLWDLVTGAPPLPNPSPASDDPGRRGLLEILAPALDPDPLARPDDLRVFAARLGGAAA